MAEALSEQPKVSITQAGIGGNSSLQPKIL